MRLEVMGLNPYSHMRVSCDDARVWGPSHIKKDFFLIYDFWKIIYRGRILGGD
jgi:hypothetical protein